MSEAERRSAVVGTLDFVMKLWPLWAVIFAVVVGYLKQQWDVNDIKADIAAATARRDKMMAEHQNAAQADHDKLVETRTIVDCIRNHNCGQL